MRFNEALGNRTVALAFSLEKPFGLKPDADREDWTYTGDQKRDLEPQW